MNTWGEGLEGRVRVPGRARRKPGRGKHGGS